MRTGMAPTGVTNGPATPEATGLEIDKMSSRHVRTHFDAFIGEILRRIPAEDRKTFKVVVQDSYETGGQNFTDDFMQTFESVYGYSMLPLPARILTVERCVSGPQRPLPVGSAAPHSRPSGISICRRPA